MLQINELISVPLDEFTLSFARSGGPGGQNVNKVSSKATLRWNLGLNQTVPDAVKVRFRALFPSRVTLEDDVVITSDATRDQARNRDDCLLKLQAMLLKATIVPKARKASKPSRASKQRRLNDKKHQSAKKTERKSNSDD